MDGGRWTVDGGRWTVEGGRSTVDSGRSTVEGYANEELTTHDQRLTTYWHEWGIDPSYQHRGGITQPQPERPPRQVWLLQRSNGKVGERLGKTTGWAHRLTLKNRGVQMWPEVNYLKIDDAGLHITVKGQPQILDVENVVICAGQNSLRDLYEPLAQAGIKVRLIGGAKEAGELDAKRAIEEGFLLATDDRRLTT